MDQSAEKVFIEGFKALSTKLQEKSAKLSIWWRDDDLSFWNARVGTFVERTAALDASVLVSAIPEKLDYLSWRSAKIPRGWRIGQHGYSHENFAAPGAANSEYPTDRVGDVVSYELEFGRNLLSEVFEDAYCDVFVPPWSQFGDTHSLRLVSLGFRGFSSYGINLKPALGDIRQRNVVVDLTDWNAPGGYSFKSPDAVFGAIRQAVVAALHLGDVDIVVGVCTHHRTMDDGAWAVCDALYRAIAAADRIRWTSIDETFALESRGTRDADD